MCESHTLVGEKFQFPASYDLDLNDRIDTNLRASLLKDTGLYAKAKKIHIFFDLNAKHKLIEETLTAVSSTGLSYTTFHASEVVGSQELLKKIQQNQIQAQEKEVAIVNIVRSQSIGLGYALFFFFFYDLTFSTEISLLLIKSFRPSSVQSSKPLLTALRLFHKA